MQFRHSGQPDWSEAAWDRFVTGHAGGHPLQLAAWGALKGEFGWRAARLALAAGEDLVAGAQVLFHPLPRLGFLPFSVAYVPKGPLLDWEDGAQVQAFLPALYDFCRRRGALLLKIEPEQPDAPALSRRLRGLGFHASARAVQPRTTLWLHLRGAEEEWLAAMKPKWRYNVRLAERRGVEVRVGGAEDLPLFAALMQATGERNHFGVHDPAYYRRFWQLFAPSGHAALLIAEHAGQPLAALMLAQLAGKAYYLYGASANEGRHLMPNHLLQFRAMRWARAQGCSTYDLWGVPDEVGLDAEAPPPEAETGLWGVWQFKRGFGGEIRRYTGAWDRLLWLGAVGARAGQVWAGRFF